MNIDNTYIAIAKIVKKDVYISQKKEDTDGQDISNFDFTWLKNIKHSNINLEHKVHSKFEM